jgi:hypothetical protein
MVSSHHLLVLLSTKDVLLISYFFLFSALAALVALKISKTGEEEGDSKMGEAFRSNGEKEEDSKMEVASRDINRPAWPSAVPPKPVPKGWGLEHYGRNEVASRPGAPTPPVPIGWGREHYNKTRNTNHATWGVKAERKCAGWGRMPVSRAAVPKAVKSDKYGWPLN